jgi:hypothetical protein
VLLDESRQSNLSDGTLRAFLHRGTREEIFDRVAFRSALGGTISDNDFVLLVNAYNNYKTTIGLPLRAPAEVAHQNYFRKRGLAYAGTREPTQGIIARFAVCWSCKQPLTTEVDLECNACGWMICACGACGCGKKNAA